MDIVPAPGVVLPRTTRLRKRIPAPIAFAIPTGTPHR
jgi:hypothetical protein